MKSLNTKAFGGLFSLLFAMAALLFLQVSGAHIPASVLLPASASIVIRGTPKQKTGRLKAVIGVIDESGNETRVKAYLKSLG